MTAASMPGPGSPFGRSNLTQQLEQNEGDRTPTSSSTKNASPRPRSRSDAPRPTLSPSPAFRESIRSISKDDSAVPIPTTPRRPALHLRGLSLQMPSYEPQVNPSMSRVPLSPKLDSSQIYGSPASMLPRRSRGLDYTRACTNLHLSTLADTSPEASPNGGRAIQIPQKRSIGGNTVLDSPSTMSNVLWSSMHGERTTLSSSVSSINMLDSDSDSDDSSDDMAVDRDVDDPVINTPAASRLNNNGVNNSPGMDWLNNQPSPAQSSLMSFQRGLMSFRRARLRKGKSSHSSSSVSIRSSKPSPGPLSPPIMKSVEPGGYFGSGLSKQQVQSRRESLSLGTNDLHLSDSEDGEESKVNGSSGNWPGEQGVIRRAVTRRSNLLPKSKGFARIRAALLEESDPLYTEARREAEVIKQVQESEPAINSVEPVLEPSAIFTTEPVESSIENNTNNQAPTNDSFSQHAKRNSGGLGFWNNFDERYRTPPPPNLPQDSSGTGDDFMDFAGSSMASSVENPALKHLNRSRSRSVTPLASSNAPTAGDVARKVNNKRRRDDDFDPASFKRRAVSPGMSTQSSPVIPQSPGVKSDRSWGRPPPKQNDRSNSGGSLGGGVKRVGLQGMTETSEGFMSMSID